jgi:5-methyltetrahydrofolate--homocysteine methyltransferase
MKADLREIARYLGYGSALPDSAVMERIHLCLSQLQEVSSPRYVSRKMEKSALEFHSAELERHLAGCGEVFLFAATLGAQADTLLRRYAATDMSLAVVGQACAASLLENYCDECMEKLSAALPGGQYLRPRYSPGYGDFSPPFSAPCWTCWTPDAASACPSQEAICSCPSNR